MFKKYVVFIMVGLLALSACSDANNVTGEENEDMPSEQAIQDGKDLFAQSVIGSQAGCIACHSLSPGVTLVGPSLAGIGSRAGDIVSGQSAEIYLRESILNPDAYVAEGFSEGLMPKSLGDELTDDQVNNLVAYMLSLK